MLQESIATDQSFDMDTTTGALALAGAKSKNNADVVNLVSLRMPLIELYADMIHQLLNAGAIILGKTSVSVSIEVYLNQVSRVADRY